MKEKIPSDEYGDYARIICMLPILFFINSFFMSICMGCILITIFSLLHCVMHWIRSVKLPWGNTVTIIVSSVLICSITYCVISFFSENGAHAVFIPLGLFSATCILYAKECYENGRSNASMADSLIETILDLIPILACFVGVSLMLEILGYGDLDFSFGFRDPKIAKGVVPLFSNHKMSGFFILALTIGAYRTIVKRVRRRTR